MLQAIGLSAFLLLWVGFAQALAAQDYGFLQQKPVAYEGLTDKTLRFVSDQYGAGAFYLSPSGQVFLWLEGDYEVVTGVWTAETSRETRQSSTSSALTVRYFDVFLMEFPKSKRRIDLFPGLGGSGLLFGVDDMDSKLGVLEKVDSDVLRLQDGTGPCRACRAGMTLSELLASKSP